MSHTASARDGSYGMSFGAGLGSALCLALTGWILHAFGEMTGTTAEAKQIFSKANLAVHILGFVLMGLALGYFLNKRSRNWFWAAPCAILLLSTAGYTWTNLYGFSSAQRITATKRIEDAKKKAADKQAERTLLAQKRQEAQERLAKSQLGFMQAEVRDAASNRERKALSKNFAKDSAAIIAEIGKEAVAAPDTKVETEVDADVGATELAKIAGMTTEMVQVGLAMWLAKLFVGLEMLLWPMASFTWPRKIAVATTIIDATYTNVVPAAPAAPPVATDLMEAPGPTPLLAPPEPPVADNLSTPEQVPTPTRHPLPGSEQSLSEIGFQPDKTHAGPKRDKRPPKEAALGFLAWLRAFDLVRDPLTDQDMTRLYAEFCEADHREQTAENLMRGELKNMRKYVTWGKPRAEDGSRSARWTIKPGKYPKVTAPEPAPAHPKQEGVLLRMVRPLAEAPSDGRPRQCISAESAQALAVSAHEPAAEPVVANATSPAPVDEIAQRRHVHRMSREHPALLRALAHTLRREGRNRKQRGNRSGRRAA